MRFGTKIKEGIARTIGGHFTTSEIVNIFSDSNILTDRSLYAKWRITLDAFNKISTDEIFFHIIENFCHPLNFLDLDTRKIFIEKLNTLLKYEYLDLVATDYSARIVDLNDETPLENIRKPTKTSTDHIVEALNFFKNEYNKVRISGLAYEYSLGENANSQQLELDDAEEYTLKLEAIRQLKDVGFIHEYKIEERVEGFGYYIWDYAICKIDESKMTQKEAPPVTDTDAQALFQKIVHEHTHRFENSIQEKEIALKHEFIEDEVLVKNKKKIALPKFPSTEWSKAEIKFIDKNNVLLKAGKKTAMADYEGLGFCNDKNGKPNTAWGFLFELAKRNGETPIIESPVPDKIKQHKMYLSDRLKTIFKNDTDPFYDFPQSSSYKIKLKLIPPIDEKPSDSLGVDEYFKEATSSECEESEE